MAERSERIARDRKGFGALRIRLATGAALAIILTYLKTSPSTSPTVSTTKRSPVSLSAIRALSPVSTM